MFTSDVEFPSVLKGVSTQRWDLRVPGALDESLNMLNDPVTGLRRRPGFSLKASVHVPTSASDQYYGWFQELNGYNMHLLVECSTGTVYAFDENLVFRASATSPYLQATSHHNIKHTTLSGTAWLANTEKKPAAVYTETRLDPKLCGYFQCVLGEFEREYNLQVEVKTGTGTISKTVTYTTPAAGGATKTAAVPSNVVLQLMNSIVTAFSAEAVTLQGTQSAHVAFLKAVPSTGVTVEYVRVTTTNTSSYLQASEKMVVALATQLPNKLPDIANTCIVAQGTSSSTYVYYEYNAVENLWKECRAYGYVSGITQAPAMLSLAVTGGVYTLSISTAAWPGASAGDADTNKVPHWVSNGVDGITAVQGRLGILSEDTLTLSESGYPTRHFRSTVGSLATTDRISVSGGAAASAKFTAAIPFNKDLLLFSESHLCVVPIGTSVLSPSNTAVLTNCRLSAEDVRPVETGQTVQFLSRTNPPLIYEVYPNADLTSVYNVSSATDHIRGYIPEGIQWTVGMPGTGLSVFATDTTLLVNEYVWAGSERPLNAWHKWTSPADKAIVALYGTHDKLVTVLRVPATVGYQLLICELAPRNADDPVLDFWQELTPDDSGILNHGAALYMNDTYWAAQSTGAVRCSRSGVAPPGGTGRSAPTLPAPYPSGSWYVGVPFSSTVQFPPYIPRGDTGLGRYREAIWVQAELDVSGTGEFTASVPGYPALPVAGVAWTDDKFDQYRTSSEYLRVTIPVRERMPVAYVRLSTAEPYQLNILRALYRTRLNNQFRRS